MEASTGDHRDALLMLLDSGADINAAATDGTTALAEALAGNKIDKAKFLLKHGANPKRLGDPGTSLLHAARLFHEQAMESDDYLYLIDLFAGLTDNINARDADGMTVLMWVAATNNQAALKAVLARHPDLDARTADGRTAMMWAACSHAKDAMQTLRAAGADDALRDATGRTAAEWLVWATAPPNPPPRACLWVRHHSANASSAVGVSRCKTSSNKTGGARMTASPESRHSIWRPPSVIPPRSSP